MAYAAASELPRIELMDVGIHRITEKECVQHVFDEMDRGHGGWVVTPNLDHVRRLTRSDDFRELYAEATLSVADEVLDGSLVCLDTGPTIYRGLRGELEYYFGAAFVREVDAAEALDGRRGARRQATG